MFNLKYKSMLMVGNTPSKLCFEDHFKEVFLVTNNEEALEVYSQKNYPIVFLYEGLDIAKKIRQKNRDTIIVIVTKKITKENLVEAIPLHLSGFIEMTFEQNSINRLLNNIKENLSFINPHIYWLKNNYSFDLYEKRLYNQDHLEVKLTKSQRQFMEILLKSKNKSVSVETIEHTIWEEDSLEFDCRGRLKVLINGIRKKLPKGSISNNYGVGYRIESKHQLNY